MLPITGLPAGLDLQGYGVFESRSGTLLVTEQRSPDGTLAYFTFDPVGSALQARVVGPQSLPGEMLGPPTHTPTQRSVGGATGRFWVVDAEFAPERAPMLVSAPHLASLRALPVSGGQWQLSPRQDSELALRHLVLRPDGSAQRECVIEPNITAAQDRMTTFGAWWVPVFDEPHLLVGMVYSSPGDGPNGGFRLYNPDMELVSETTGVVQIDPGAAPDLVLLDLTGDAALEIVVMGASVPDGPPLAVLEAVRGQGVPVFGFHLCSVRANGPGVSRLQTLLERAGYSVGRSGIDGWYGPDTRAAVIRLQRDQNLPVSGVVTRAVWSALGVQTEEES